MTPQGPSSRQRPPSPPGPLSPPGIESLVAYLDASPTPYHAVAAAARRLEADGFAALDLEERWVDIPERGYVTSGGALVAWSLPPDSEPLPPMRIVGAHTDSPGLRIRPQPDQESAGFRQLGVEVYGGALVNSWLDRDLGLAGRVAVTSADRPGVTTRLVRIDRPLLRVPQLAIHLDRSVNEQGLKLDRQQHLTPIWGTGPTREGDFRRFLATTVGVPESSIRGWDLLVTDLAPATRVGLGRSLLSSGRLDNLCCCWAAVDALVAADGADTGAVTVLFDHEEVGSTSATGADGALLPAILERIATGRGGDREDLLRSLAASAVASADMAHATHPNYPERHEPAHTVRIDGGPVIKLNVNQRYATDAMTQAAFEVACEVAGVPVQRFTTRGDMPCGSTIGPVTAARLGVATVDVGVAQLAMHSARELCGVDDPTRFRDALIAWFAP